MNLSDCRKKIDALDDEIMKCFVERMHVSADIARLKAEANLPVWNPARERDVLARISQKAGPELDGYARMLYRTLFDVSRARQNELSGRISTLSAEIRAARAVTPGKFPAIATVAVQGGEGAYAQLAAAQLFEVPKITWVTHFTGVAQAVGNGLCKYGILPVENSYYGTANQVYDLMLEHKVHIVQSLRMQVSHSLLAKPGAKLEDIREVLSYEQALAQCEKFFRENPQIKATLVTNTAVAARMLAESDRRDLAAIGTDVCAKLYGLEVLSRKLQTSGNNYTRFICIAKDMQVFPGASRISLALTLPHHPGALYSIIAKFAALGLNLLKLESCPVPGSNLEFRFYIDLATQACSDSLLSLLDQLSYELQSFIFLGWYSEQ